jgi:hypothetical protein
LVRRRGQIDDGQPAEPESQTGCLIDPGAGIVGAAMHKRLRHPHDLAAEDFSGCRPLLQKAGYAAHCRTSIHLNTLFSRFFVNSPGYDQCC